MTAASAASAAYIVAALLFILSLAGLSKHETAKAGNVFGMAGMAIALVATIGLAADHGISGTGAGLLAGSRGSAPAMAWSRSAASRTVRAIGPTWSCDQLSGTTPWQLTRP